MILPDRVFGRSAAKMMSSGRAMRADLAARRALQLVGQRLGEPDALLQGDERADGLALDLVRAADHRGFGHRG